MLNNFTVLIYIIGGVVAGLLIGVFVNRILNARHIQALEEGTKKTLEGVEKEVEAKKKELLLESKENTYKIKREIERENESKISEIQTNEKRLNQRIEHIEKKSDDIDRREREVIKKEREIFETEAGIRNKSNELEELIKSQKRELETISGMTAEEAKTILKEKILDDARIESVAAIKKIENEAQEKAKIKADMIVSLAVQRCSPDYVAETTVSVVYLPNDDMKGKIIGREGRNIRSLEIATGVDLIVDDTPEAVTLSCHDPIKREIAKLSLERLMADGRIHPGRIEEIVDKARRDMNNKIKEEGEKATFEVGIDGLHPEAVKLLGRLKYRTSYSQNVLQHSIEVAHLAGIMAAELNLDQKMAKRAGLLHDIGKAVDHQTEGTHTQIGVDLARRYNESKLVINAIGSHHGDIEAETAIAVLVAAADALSASRPGARREMLETYIKRLEQLEAIGKSFKGVEKAFGIQAGREIRVIVIPDKVSDKESIFLAKDIAKKIEQEMAYPGEIKVTVLRETRATEYAR
ncbi:MAG: ribonuclease Y [Nitrospinota bacterium]